MFAIYIHFLLFTYQIPSESFHHFSVAFCSYCQSVSDSKSQSKQVLSSLVECMHYAAEVFAGVNYFFVTQTRK